MGLMISTTEKAATPGGKSASASAASDAAKSARRDMPAAGQAREVRRPTKGGRVFPPVPCERGFRVRGSQTVARRASAVGLVHARRYTRCTEI